MKKTRVLTLLGFMCSADQQCFTTRNSTRFNFCVLLHWELYVLRHAVVLEYYFGRVVRDEQSAADQASSDNNEGVRFNNLNSPKKQRLAQIYQSSANLLELSELTHFPCRKDRFPNLSTTRL